MAPIVEETLLGGPQKTNCVRNFLPFVLGILAIILGTAPSFECETVSLTQIEGNDDLVLLAGPFSYKTKYASQWPDSSFSSTRCRNYKELERNTGFKYEADSETKTVWSFAVLTPLLGILVILKSFMIATCSASRGSTIGGGWKCMGVFFLLTSVFQGLNLLVDSSSICLDNPALQYLEETNSDLANTFPDSCDLAMGYYLGIVAVVLWALAGLSTFAFPEPVIIHEHPSQEQTVTYTQKADGTVEEARVAIIKGTHVDQTQ